MKQIDKYSIPFLRFENFPNNGRVRHAIFTRQGGTSPEPFDTLNLSLSVPDNETNVYANRARAYASHGRHNNALVHAHLTHGAGTALVSQKQNGQYIGPVDALLTDEPGCGLTMNYADCAAILLYDPLKGAIGLGHAGWKGAVKDLPGAMVRRMGAVYGSQPDQLIAAIGPAIGPCCYEVGEAVITAVRATFDEPGSLLLPSPDQSGSSPADLHRQFDLPEANHRRLSYAGVRHIEKSGLCTACRTDLFFSHRAEKGRTGRFGTLLILGQ